MKCHKCRSKAVVVGADGNPYCDYCKQYAPKPTKELLKEERIFHFGPVALHIYRVFRGWEHGVQVRRFGAALELWRQPV